MIRQEGNPFLEIYLHEFTSTIIRLHEIRAALESEEIEQAKALINAEINVNGKFSVIQQKVKTLYPQFIEVLDQALAEGKITQLVWRVAHCIKLGMAPSEVAKVLPTTSRSVSTQAHRLRRMGILEKVNK